VSSYLVATETSIARRPGILSRHRVILRRHGVILSLSKDGHEETLVARPSFDRLRMTPWRFRMTFDKLRMTFDRLRMTFDRLRMTLKLCPVGHDVTGKFESGA